MWYSLHRGRGAFIVCIFPKMVCPLKQLSSNKSGKHVPLCDETEEVRHAVRRTWPLFLSGGKKDKEKVRMHSNDDSPLVAAIKRRVQSSEGQ